MDLGIVHLYSYYLSYIRQGFISRFRKLNWNDLVTSEKSLDEKKEGSEKGIL